MIVSAAAAAAALFRCPLQLATINDQQLESYVDSSADAMYHMRCMVFSRDGCAPQLLAGCLATGYRHET